METHMLSTDRKIPGRHEIQIQRRRKIKQKQKQNKPHFQLLFLCF